MTTEQRTIAFHEAFGHPVRDVPQTLDRDEAILALALIEEEFHELCEALFPGSTDLLDSPLSNIQDGRAKYAPNLIETADALADLDVVINGAGIRHGFDMQALSRAVAQSNDSKLGGDGKPVYHANGKISKGPLYEKPDIAGALGL